MGSLILKLDGMGEVIMLRLYMETIRSLLVILYNANYPLTHVVQACAMAMFLLRSNVDTTGLGMTKSNLPCLLLRLRLDDLLA